MNTPAEPHGYLFLLVIAIKRPVPDLFYPRGNFIGGHLFGELIKQELLAEGIQTAEVVFTGELNLSTCLITDTSDARVPEIVRQLHRRVIQTGSLQCWRVSDTETKPVFPADALPFEAVRAVMVANNESSAVMLRDLREVAGLPPG